MTPREAGIQAFYADESTTNTLQGLNAAFDAYEATTLIGQNQMVPTGWTVVPVEPTEAMCRAGESSKGASSPEAWVDGSYTPENVELIWKDMLAVCPPAKAKEA